MRGSKIDLPIAFELDGGALRHAEWGGMNAELGAADRDLDLGPFLAGLPNGCCPAPRWGYVIRGQLRYRFARREEVFTAGDLYYAPPGHIPIIAAGAEYVEFSPVAALRQTLEVLGRNAVRRGG